MTPADTYQQLLADGILTPEAEFGTPPGTGYAIDAKTGRQVLVHLPPAPEPVVQYVHAPAPAPVTPAVPRDPWAVRILAGGVSTAAVLVAAGSYASQLGEVGHALEAVGIGVGALAGGLALVKGASPRVDVSVTANITGASATSSSTSSSAAGWKPNSS